MKNEERRMYTLEAKALAEEKKKLLSTWEAATGGSPVQGQLGLHNDFQVSQAV